MRKVILTSDWKDHKVGETIELENDEASLVVNTAFGQMHPDTIAAEAEVARKQAETPAPAYKAPEEKKGIFNKHEAEKKHGK